MIEARIRKTRFPEPGTRVPALDVEFRATGELTVLFGASGAGKTVVLDAIAGLLQPDEGRILVDDQILYDREAKIGLPPALRRCGYVFPGLRPVPAHDAAAKPAVRGLLPASGEAGAAPQSERGARAVPARGGRRAPARGSLRKREAALRGGARRDWTAAAAAGG